MSKRSAPRPKTLTVSVGEPKSGNGWAGPRSFSWPKPAPLFGDEVPACAAHFISWIGGGNEHYHGETIEAAIRGLKAKCQAAMYLMDLDSSANAFADKYASVLINVSLDDARKTGSCEYGIRSWCASVGIDVERIEVPMGELLEGFRRRPMPEVRRAVLKAVKRNRVKLVS